MIKSVFSIALASLCFAWPALAADSPQFRGPTRDGMFADQNLLDSWPEAGPKKLWSIGGLGESYASVSAVGDRLYTTGMKDLKGTVYALDTEGKVIWQTTYGEEHSGSGYPGTRTTPTVDGDHLYLLSSMGKAMAINTADGKVTWEVDILERFGGSNIYFGISESPLIDGPRVIFTPGGKDASVVALDKATGKTVWQTKGLSDAAAYCSPRIFDDGKRRQILTLVGKNLVGIDPETGKVLWRQTSEVNYDIHAVSPMIHGDVIYVTHGYDQGGEAFTLAADGGSVTSRWKETELDIHHGGGVMVDGRIYGAASKKSWFALDADTGKIVATIKRPGKGSIVHADGKLYGYVESGEVLLVDPDPANFKVISKFKIKEGDGHHWSHPVIANGVLYIRHGEVLMAFDIKKP